jgi:hypothetical protein
VPLVSPIEFFHLLYCRGAGSESRLEERLKTDHCRLFGYPVSSVLNNRRCKTKPAKKGVADKSGVESEAQSFSLHSSRAGQIRAGLYNPRNFWSRLDKVQLLLNQLLPDSGTAFRTSGRTGLEYLVEYRSKELQCTVYLRTRMLYRIFLFWIWVRLSVELRPSMGSSWPTDDG